MKKHELGEIYLDAVEFSGAGRRRLNEAVVDSLVESLGRIGLQTPISVYDPDPTDASADLILIAGLHRYEAAKRLGWEKIDCVYVAMDDLDRQLWEIDENLCRAELTEIEHAEHLKRRREIFDAKRNSGENIPSIPGRGRPKEFDQDTADKTGLDKSTVRKSRTRAEKIAEDVREDIKTSSNEKVVAAADSGVELDALASLSHDDQRQAVKLVEDGASENIRAAKAFIRGDDDDDTERQCNTLIGPFLRAPEEVRNSFIATLIGHGFITSSDTDLMRRLCDENHKLKKRLQKNRDQLRQCKNQKHLLEEHNTRLLEEKREYYERICELESHIADRGKAVGHGAGDRRAPAA